MSATAFKLEAFECQRCNRCCQQPGRVALTDEDVDRLADFFGLTPYAFTEDYCDLQGRHRLVLKKREDESCVFLAVNGCTVHSAKPQQCLDFPKKWRTEKSYSYCEGLKRLWPKA
ncbi:MAG: YkgJ family cysteine cluster protein [Candidatus Omnitrophota bacterium]|nr:YkgJ family cysteine cluster protein [Candidatus Omnitrophota bacterium]